MSHVSLPVHPCDVLGIPGKDVPEVVRGLVQSRTLSPLMKEIHRELWSENPELRASARQALEHLGFTD